MEKNRRDALRKVVVSDGNYGIPEQVGYFHAWGTNADFTESGAAHWTVAIVELEDGRVIEVAPSKIRFVDAVDDVQHSTAVSDKASVG